MKKVLALTILLPMILLLSGCASTSSPVVKKSTTGICHQEGTLFYENTENFTPFESLQECLDSGGRLPKK